MVSRLIKPSRPRSDYSVQPPLPSNSTTLGKVPADYAEREERDFALFNSGREAAAALYGVGFFGVALGPDGRYRFCHDGSLADIEPTNIDAVTVIHPCYWSALNLRVDTGLEEVAVQIDDDLYRKGAEGRIKDLRVRLLGQIVGELPKLPLGDEGAKEFEDRVFRTVRMFFGGALSNFELKPNPGQIQQRDILATVMATAGFWKRIFDDYGSLR